MQRIVFVAASAALLLGLCAGVRAAAGGKGGAKKPSLKEALGKLKVPPRWFKGVKVNYDLKKPWKDARLHIRKLLGGTPEEVREGMALTYLYFRKGDIGDGHELALYLFLGGEYAWAFVEYRKRLASAPEGRTHEYLNLASCYAHFGEYKAAEQIMNVALQRLPKPPWRIANEAKVHDHFGDLYAAMGKADLARRHYRRAAELFPTSDQPYGRHLLKRHAERVRTKIELLDMRSLDFGRLRDGSYRGTAIGFRGDITVAVTVRGGKVADVRAQHKEDIDQGATRVVPERIVEAQSLEVDGVTGATVTSEAVVIGTFRALKQAGMK
jgi:uncharacterized protein with FMN-binding domain